MYFIADKTHGRMQNAHSIEQVYLNILALKTEMPENKTYESWGGCFSLETKLEG